MSFLASTYIVRAQPQDFANPRASRRIIIHANVLKSAKVFAGDVVVVLRDKGRPDEFHVGLAWPSNDLDPQTVHISSAILSTTDLASGDPVYISTLPTTKSAEFPWTPAKDITLASEIWLQELQPLPTQPATRMDKEPASESRDWLCLACRELLVDLKYITDRQVIEVAYEGLRRKFRIQGIVSSCSTSLLDDQMGNLSLANGPPASYRIWSINWDTRVYVTKKQPPADHPSERESTVDPYANVGGLDKQIEQVRDLIEIPLTRPQLFRQFGLRAPRGILLYGPPGTGKTHLARTIASSSRTTLLTISGPELSSAYHGETEQKLREIFEEAKRKSPCIIVIDEVDTLCPKREDTGGGVEGRVVATLLTLMDGIEDKEKAQDADDVRVVVVATTNRPNAIDPALRRPGRFDREIEIGIPDSPARLSILRVLLAKIPHSITPEELSSIANSTHGYVGADLAAVVRTAGTQAIKRSFSVDPPSAPILTISDLVQATSAHQPSALREYAIETPNVKWADIGGQATVKQKLKESVEWPLLHPEAFRRLGVKPPKGVLLYGPPGCSKTLTAKALASESGVNFIAVKGPELLNKYVGESERAVREIFRKARAAAPSIVFFDEIDALAGSRSDYGDSHEGVLTSLLNEMDGIQELIGVTIVAATNRPDVIDSALMRPGRLDRILYVGPPDLEARKEILRIAVKKMAVDPTLSIDELASLTDGCSGAELISVCQDAALMAMQEDIHTPFVATKHFRIAAEGMRRQITPEMIQEFEDWRRSAGVRNA